MSNRYFAINKIRGMTSQFARTEPGLLLGDIDFDFPEGTHAIGRLDKQSEGLLLLTTDKTITRRLFQGSVPHARRYLVQARYQIHPDNIEKLRTGISICIKGGGQYFTPPCEVMEINDPERLLPWLTVPFRYEPSTWLQITLTEGKYHQVRKMIFAAGHRCLRLIRLSIEDIDCASIDPGHVQEMSEQDFLGRLRL